VGEQFVAPVARRGAQRIGGRHVADREHAPVVRHPQGRQHADEPVLVEQFGG
jgi:hypothetical protein